MSRLPFVSVVLTAGLLAGPVLLAGCASDPGPKPESDAAPLPAPELDERYEGDGFSIQPPRDWGIGVGHGDWVLRPPRTHIEYINAVAKIVISRSALPEGVTPATVEEFSDLVVTLLEESELELDIKDVKTSTGNNGRMIVDVTVEQKTEKGTSHFRILNEYAPEFSSRGFWRASVSSWKGYWDRVSPLLLASLRSIRFGAPPTAGRDLPPSMRDH